MIRKESDFSLLFYFDCVAQIAQIHFAIKMPSLFLFLYAFLTLTSSIQAKGTKPRANFGCNTLDNPKPIDVIIETGSERTAGTDDFVGLFLHDSHGLVCTATDLNNPGDDHERNSIDYYILCCPQNFAKTNDSLSLLLLQHERCGKGGAFNNWFIERIEVRMNGLLLLQYRFHAWTNGELFGVSKVTSSRSNNGTPLYALIRL